jgi:hypothetical protein
MKNALVSICALVALSGVASADVITAKYDIPFDPGANTHLQMRAPSAGSDPAFRDEKAVVINGRRQDSPGAGVDANIPSAYPTYCVEIDENVQVSVGGVFNASSYTHEVLPLLGSTTQAGGLSGPVTFDALRTYRMERLWGQFYVGALNQTDATYSGAFQLAQWEIAFESASALDLFDGASRFSVTDGATALNSLAQSMLDALAVSGPQTALYLLSNNGVQDLVTPVPAPSAIGMIAVAGLAAGRRRR